MPRAKAKVNKSKFVRTMSGAPAKDVVAAAAKRGIKLSARYVYVIRSSDKARERRRAGRPGRPAGSRRGRGSAEVELRRAIAELGLARARQILREVEAAFAR